MWKDFFYFTRTEKRAIILLSILIVVLVIIRFLPDVPTAKPETAEDDFEKEYAAFIATVREKDTPVNQNYKEPITVVRLSPFDPNTADSVTFTLLGLKPWIAGNILRYRAKGGKFRKPEDFRKIYGLTNEKFEELLPYIAIEKEFVPPKDTIPSVIAETRDTFPHVFKYPAGTVINLNEADTTELKKIPGVGSGIARRITDYRRRLGGFYTVNQLQDINLDTAVFAGWFTTGDYQTTRININKVSVDRLRNHPYFNFYQAKAIVELRKKKGALKSLDEVALMEEFTEKDFDRMKHYVSFE